MGKENIRVSFPIPQSGVQASPHQVLQLRLAALLFCRQAQQLLIVARSPGQRLLELRRLVLLRSDLPLEPADELFQLLAAGDRLGLLFLLRLGGPLTGGRLVLQNGAVFGIAARSPRGRSRSIRARRRPDGSSARRARAD